MMRPLGASAGCVEQYVGTNRRLLTHSVAAGLRTEHSSWTAHTRRTSLWSDTGRMLKAITSWLLPAGEGWW